MTEERPAVAEPLTPEEELELREQRRQFPDLIGVSHFDAIAATLDAARSNRQDGLDVAMVDEAIGESGDALSCRHLSFGDHDREVAAHYRRLRRDSDGG